MHLKSLERARKKEQYLKEQVKEAEARLETRPGQAVQEEKVHLEVIIIYFQCVTKIFVFTDVSSTRYGEY